MLKIKSILVSLLAITALASCSNDLDDDSDGGVTKGYDVAYVSISLITYSSLIALSTVFAGRKCN